MSRKKYKRIDTLYNVLSYKQEQIVTLELDIKKIEKEMIDIKKIINILEKENIYAY